MTQARRTQRAKRRRQHHQRLLLVVFYLGPRRVVKIRRTLQTPSTL